MTLELALCMIAIVAAILIGWKTGINTGIIAAACAFIIGCILMKFSVTKIIAFWPTNIAYFIIICALFFGFAIENGTVDKIGKKLLYLIDGRAALIPFISFLVGFTMGSLGAGMGSIAMMGAFTYPLAVSAGVSPFATILAGMGGAVVGINNPITGQSGVVISNLIATAGYPDESLSYGTSVFLSRLLAYLLILVIFYIFTKGYKAKQVAVQKPEPFSPIQRKTFWLLMGATLFILVSVIGNTILKDNAVFKALARLAQPQAVFTIATIIAMAMKLADTKEVMKKIPLNSVLMISCFSMLMGVAQEAGLVEYIGGLLAGVGGHFLIRFLCVLLAGCMSFFCSGTGVVFPLLFPMVPTIAASTGINPAELFVCMTIGSCLSSYSPFSTGGSMMIAGTPNPALQEKMFNQLILLAIVSLLSAAVLAGLGFWKLVLL